MAVDGLKFVSRSSIHLRPNSLFQYVHKVVSRSFVAVDKEAFFRNENGSGWISEEENEKYPKWKKLDCKELGIHDSMIPSTEWKVLNGLKNKGYDVFLVGGCVRDFILKQTPKDYDIITSAELNQVMETFSRCEIVGKRYPVCHVHIDDITVVVSNYYKPECESFIELGHLPLDGCGENDILRSMNCSNRDFTINGLFLDPYARVVYDYTGGIEDIRKAKVRTIIPADRSFQIDCARILRAICFAARLGFIISDETAHSVEKMSSSVKKLDKGRLLMEIHNMLAYGSGEASLKLLWKFSLLDKLLPFQALYFARLKFICPFNRNMLLSLFSNLDKLLAPNRPCHSSLWLGILAFHKTLSDRPREPLVVVAFCRAVYNGGNLSEAMKISGLINKRHERRFLELLYPSNQDSEAFKAQILDLAWSVRGTLLQMIDKRFLNRAMGDLPQAPQAPHSELVCNPLGSFEKALSIFECVLWGYKEKSLPKQGMKINYKSLAHGDLSEIRYVFAKIVVDTVFLDPVSPRILSKEF